jgi:hypothetical protein
MTDLTKITTPFGLLDPETREALKAHGGPYEYYSLQGWFPASFAISLSPHLVFRVKPQPTTKPSIDWSHVAPEYKWLARDKCGDAYLYLSEPELCQTVWISGGEHTQIARVFASYTPGTCDWRDSLVERPE